MTPPTPPATTRSDSSHPNPPAPGNPTPPFPPYRSPPPSYETATNSTPVHNTLGASASAPAVARRDRTALLAAIHRALSPVEIAEFVTFAGHALRNYRQLRPGLAPPPPPEFLLSFYLSFRETRAALESYSATIEVLLEGNVEALLEQLLSGEE